MLKMSRLVMEWSALLTRGFLVQFQVEALLYGGCMFSPCQRMFPQGTLASLHSAKKCSILMTPQCPGI